MKKIKAGIVGGAGYTGGELLRILVNHPQADIAFVHSKSSSGKYIYQVHSDLLGETTLKFTDGLSSEIDVLFLCLGHGESKKFLSEHKIAGHIKIIDLSQDFRLNDPAFTYGLPEWNKKEISAARHIANPGCFATCIQLALLPLASKNMLQNEVHISATTGSTGAGQAPSDTSHFSWRSNNLSFYKAFTHQHLAEIRQSAMKTNPSFKIAIHFMPYRGSFTRGIFSTLHTSCSLSLEDCRAIYEEAYAHSPFVFVSRDNIDLKQVVNTNKCIIYLEKHDNQLVVASIIDNLLKGASGQAVQNMNLLFGVEESTGLKLKATAF